MMDENDHIIIDVNTKSSISSVTEDVEITPDGEIIVPAKLYLPGPYIYYFPQDEDECKKKYIGKKYLNINNFLEKYINVYLKKYKMDRYVKITDPKNKVDAYLLEKNIWYTKDNQEFFFLKGDYLLKDLDSGEIYGCSKKEFKATYKKLYKTLFSFGYLLTKYNELMNK